MKDYYNLLQKCIFNKLIPRFFKVKKSTLDCSFNYVLCDLQYSKQPKNTWDTSCESFCFSKANCLFVLHLFGILL